jgi:2-iminobutanoate/2-iminopropanoate deaminase
VYGAGLVSICANVGFNLKNAYLCKILCTFRLKIIKTDIMKRVIATVDAPKAVGPYSQAIEVNGTLYISGQIPVNPADGQVQTEITAAAHQSLKNIGAILAEAGMTYDNVVKTTVLLADIADFKAVNEVYAEYFTGDKPARACYQAAALPLGVKVEIEAIAVR